jgi:hypothetical protein
MKRFLIAIDDFYQDHEAVRRRALQMTYSHPEGVVGWRTPYNRGGHAEMVGVRYDEPLRWQHRKTGLTSKPTKRDARTPSRWIEIDRVGNVFNRAVMFPGGFLHSASRHFGSGDGRIYQSFRFPVELGAR